MTSNKRFLISIPISKGTYKECIKSIVELGTKKVSSYVCVANVHMLVEAHQDTDFANVVKNADIITPDGMPLAKAIKSLYGIKQERIAGMDLLPDLLKKAEQDNLGVYFYGGTTEMLDNTKSYLSINYPALRISGVYSPPFRSLSAKEEAEVAKKINDAAPSIVFVVLGCPKQEKWMSAMKGKIDAVMIGVGGALPVLVGMQKRAPGWMQKNSLEWLFRLCQEPNRLFKRYFVTNTIFLILYYRALLNKFLNKSYYNS
ncbi:WecB/TagA/CpsF family glycosyltransferase [Mucilaginibacter ginsenosidivorax]|uniref:WecB/TagA/CpsF family glycosyltransferase n=1 Tax=Mucilaginibacter ginsenosidivorax TaxID=862126 RepID=A0A5B8W526_9SPHI|nr:WecB/TagA/CpsF family glycosyltransferase [Mucilaginibacter ginsenosidivorax]QEC78085.1 WecB/TagA/CpsF family glycosyltransferase [Mucilaginibacter ginsenosidivorax]